MGSILQGMDCWDDNQREAFVGAFGKLKEKVLWKYENSSLPNNPGNIKITKWLPQRDLLAHPNVKLLITHGGLLSLYEAEVEGIPILGIPMFGDQFMNIANVVRRGYALKLHNDDITEENIYKSIHELIKNPKYKEKALKASYEFKDRPLTPKLSVIYWTEYAIKHRGAQHLRNPGRDLNFIQFNSLDVYLSLFVLIATFVLLNIFVCKMIILGVFKRIKKTKIIVNEEKKKNK